MRPGLALVLALTLLLSGCAAAAPHGGRVSVPATASGATAPQVAPVAPAPLSVARTVYMHLQGLPATDLPTTLAGLAFATATQGVAVGSRCGGVGGACTGVILATADGGGHWRWAAVVPGALTQARLLPDGLGWAWGPGAVALTTDGGAGWRALGLPPDAGEPVVFASFTSAAQGWVARGGVNCATQGCPLSVFGTRDGGRSWTLLAGARLPGGAPPVGAGALPWLEFHAGGALGGGRGWLLSGGSYGALWSTADGGRGWRRAVVLAPGGGATAAAFAPGGHGWATGQTGGGHAKLFASADGGAAWRALGTVPAPLYALAATPGGGAAWGLAALRPQPCAWGRTVCGDAVVVASVYGVGSAVPAPPGYTLHALAPVSGSVAWALASGPHAGQVLLQTLDGGRNWAVRYRARGALPAGPWGFWDAAAGWAVGSAADPAAVLRTADGGRSWAAVGEVPVTSVARAGFPTPGFGWVLSGQGRLLVSRDGGRHWTARNRPRGRCAPPASVGFVAIPGAAPGAVAGWLGAGQACGSALLRSTDGGRHWRPVAVPPQGRVLAAAFAADGSGLAVVDPGTGAGRVLLEARAGPGRAWRARADLGPVNWTSGRAPRWVGAQLRLDPAGGVWLGDLRSTDGGRTWTRYALAGGGRATRIQFVSATLGWLATAQALYRTTDGGTIWRQVSALGPPGP